MLRLFHSAPEETALINNLAVLQSNKARCEYVRGLVLQGLTLSRFMGGFLPVSSILVPESECVQRRFSDYRCSLRIAFEVESDRFEDPGYQYLASIANSLDRTRECRKLVLVGAWSTTTKATLDDIGLRSEPSKVVAPNVPSDNVLAEDTGTRPSTLLNNQGSQGVRQRLGGLMPVG